MLLFLVSFILIFTSSYFIASIFDTKTEKGLAYIFLIAFAQIILTTEILSLFKLIKEVPFLCFNSLFFISTFFIWKKFKSPKWKLDTKDFFHRLKNTLKLDKSLILLSICWLFYVIISIFFIIALPNITADGKSYHVARCFYYIINQSLAHFECSNIRLIAFPINSEILYIWVLLFTNKLICLGIFSFLGYLLTCFSSYKIIRFLGFSMRKAIWTILIFSSFASVIIISVETETDLIISGLISLSIYLFLESLRTNSHKTIYMASLAYAIATGVKTTALLISPALLILLFLFSLKFSKIKYFIIFLCFTFLNFLVFSSYNYILNFSDFGNFLSSEANNIIHKNNFGLKGMFASLIKYSKMFLDFSGCDWNVYLTTQLSDYYSKLLSFLHLQTIPDGPCSSDQNIFNNSLIGVNAGCGLLSFLLVLPCFICSIIAPIFKKNKKIIFLGFFGLAILINLLVFSYFLAFMSYNIRFFTSIILISSPILIFSYYKSNCNILKITYVLIACYYLIFCTCNVTQRTLINVLQEIKKDGIVQFRLNYNCSRHIKSGIYATDWCYVGDILKENFNRPEYKVLIYPSSGTGLLQEIIKKRQGFNYEFKSLENHEKVNYNDYDILIIPKYGQLLTKFKITDTDKHISQNIDLNKECECVYYNFENRIYKQITSTKGEAIVKKCLLGKKFFEKYPFELYIQTKDHYIYINLNSISKFK